ncbi:zf-HC2 domain-containing protein [Flexivirga alba]|uniref:Zf-HC2 domain-containing protein n=1 Tax=Flexivirga alba TaxID=702742 RepID=A0ABW2AFG9_9MICO
MQHDHLGERVADYVDGMLSADEACRADIHLMVCEHCRYAVQQERAIIEQLRTVSFDSGGHQQLMAGLLSLASTGPDAPVGDSATAGRPAVAPRPSPAVVMCSAPPQYQSARKSMAFALFAVAGCVGVALVASTATGVAQGPDNPRTGTQDRVGLVRNVSAPKTADATKRRDKVSGTLTHEMPMFAQVAVRQTPDRWSAAFICRSPPPGPRAGARIGGGIASSVFCIGIRVASSP